MDAVLLLNLGSPESASVPAVKKYLREFLGDPEVITLPEFFRKILLEAVILPFYAKKSVEKYKRIATAEGFPLITGTERIRKRLEENLKAENFSVFAAMRYGQPSIAGTIQALVSAGTRRVFIVPLYPQRAESSWGSAVKQSLKILKKCAPQMESVVIEPYFAERGYISALAGTAKRFLEGKKIDKILFSFHGVPAKSDGAKNYKEECETTAELTAQALGLPRERREVVFQSRFGRGNWLAPATRERLGVLPGEGFKNVALMTPGFLVECVETLEELDLRERPFFLNCGGENFWRIPCLGENIADFLTEKILSYR